MGSYADRRKTPLSGSGRSCASALGRDLPVASEQSVLPNLNFYLSRRLLLWVEGLGMPW